MSAIRWVLVLACLLAALLLVVAEFIAATRKPAPPPADEVKLAGVVADVTNKLVEKAPRLAAAITFVLLAGFFADVLSLSVDTASE